MLDWFNGKLLFTEVKEERGEAALGDDVALQQIRERVVPQGLWQAGSQGFSSSHVVAQSEVTSDNVLEQPDSLSFYQLGDHVAEDGAHGVETLIRMADIRQTRLVQKNLLDDKDGDGLG